jgi:hypothetical protein
MSAWVRASSHPARRFGDEWLILDPRGATVLVVRGAPAVAACELLESPRELTAVTDWVERAVSASGRSASEVGARLTELFAAMREGGRLVPASAHAVPLPTGTGLARIPLEPMSFFVESLSTLFSGLSAASHPGSASLTQNGNGTPCGHH